MHKSVVIIRSPPEPSRPPCEFTAIAKRMLTRNKKIDFKGFLNKKNE